MQGNSSGGGLVAAALILGASILGGAYLLTMSIDRGSAQLAGLNDSLKAAAQAPAPAISSVNAKHNGSATVTTLNSILKNGGK